MKFPIPDQRYWEEKVIAYFHDPPDKVFQIRGHEKRAAELIEALYLQYPNDAFWKTADGIASGFERGQLPSYKEDSQAIVDFTKEPYLTHPTSRCSPLKINLPLDFDPQNIFTGFKQLLKEANLADKYSKPTNTTRSQAPTNTTRSQAPLGNVKDNQSRYAKARFFYIHLLLRFQLANENTGNLGALWHKLPADSRFPDHSIWQHNALVSALNSCMSLAKNSDDIGLMVFSITPVQKFISRARKLRDYWVGSVLLSWLAFEGITWLIDKLGPDHIIYPSLIDQPLVNEYLSKFFNDNYLQKNLRLSTKRDIASFPNKFLALIPMNYAENIGNDIREHITAKWDETAGLVKQLLYEKLNDLTDQDKELIDKLFARQNKKLWNCNWCASYLIDSNHLEQVKNLLPEKAYRNPEKLLTSFTEMIKDKEHYEKSGKGTLYSVTHSLVQSSLANIKTQNISLRDEEPGEKCQMCGEFEILHNVDTRKVGSPQYKRERTDFWRKIRESFDESRKDDHIRFNFKENERLCSVCLTKRLISQALKENKAYDHLLYKSLNPPSKEGFPSTTEMALYNYYKRKKITDPEDKIKEANKRHDKKELQADTDNRDAYYAILLMDGDRMGDLINGLTFSSRWETILHPQIYRTIKNGKFINNYQKNWDKIFTDEKVATRCVSPSIHTTISEALGDFSVYSVPQILSENDGRLIYAGGDDVCAVVPLDNAVKTAKVIRNHYCRHYHLIEKENDNGNYSLNTVEPEKEWTPQKGKLSIGMGDGKNISISGAILICHHKDSLAQSILNCHNLLENKAKKENSRNSLAVELNKRSGHSRFLIRKWSFDWELIDKIGCKMAQLDNENDPVKISTSLAYRIAEQRDTFDTILSKKGDNRDEHIKNYIYFYLKRSDISKGKTKGNNNIERNKELKNLAGDLTTLVIKPDYKENGKDKQKFDPESLIVIGFLAKTPAKKGGNK